MGCHILQTTFRQFRRELVLSIIPRFPHTYIDISQQDDLHSLWHHFQGLIDAVGIWRIMWGHIRPHDVTCTQSRRQKEACHVWDKVNNPLHLTTRVLPPDNQYSPLVPDLSLCCPYGVPLSLPRVNPVCQFHLLQDAHANVTLFQHSQLRLQPSCLPWPYF